MFKNVATKVALFAFDYSTGAPKTGDAANLTAYVSKDYGTVTVLADTSATEMSATNAPGWYLFDVAQGETNADALLFSGKSSTSNVTVVGQMVYTTSAAAIASAVRTELATELARVDAAISTRLAGASYVAPLDAAGTRSAVGLASANLDTQLGAVATTSALSTVGSNVSAVKTKTDQLNFGLTGTVNANVEAVNGGTIVGDGTTGNEWGPE